MGVEGRIFRIGGGETTRDRGGGEPFRDGEKTRATGAMGGGLRIRGGGENIRSGRTGEGEVGRDDILPQRAHRREPADGEEPVMLTTLVLPLARRQLLFVGRELSTWLMLLLLSVVARMLCLLVYPTQITLCRLTAPTCNFPSTHLP